MGFEEFYVKMLGIVEPWFVSEIKVCDEKEEEEIEIHVSHRANAKWNCPECGKISSLHDHGRERKWRHLDTCQAKTYLVARLPRVKCGVCGVKQVAASWSSSGSRFTLLMERQILKTLRRCETVKGTAELVRAGWDAVFRIMERAVERGLDRRGGIGAAKIGIDEKAFRKGHRYHTLVYDLDESCVLFVEEDRTIESLKAYYDLLSNEELKGIDAVAMDMWEAYISATKSEVPGADEKIVFDRFHVMKRATEAVDKVRRAEHKRLTAEGDESLKNTRYDWLRTGGPRKWHQRKAFRELLQGTLQTAQAWTLKEMLPKLWEYRSKTWAMKYFEKWYEIASTSGLRAMEDLAAFVKRHIANILTFCEHGITNAVAEGLNSKIMSIKRQSGGFRNAANFKVAVYFYCGNLSIDPLKTR